MSRRDKKAEVVYFADSAAKKRTLLWLRILLMASAAFYPGLMNILGGAAMIEGGGAKYGVMLLLSSALIFISIVLCFFGKNIPAVVLCLAGLVLCVVAVYSYTQIMMELGRVDFELEPRYAKYAARHYPTVIVFILLSIISIVQHFSYSSVAKREKRRTLRLAKKNKEAPRILEDD